MKRIKQRIKNYLILAEKEGKWIGRAGNRLIGRKRELRYGKFADVETDRHLVVFECYKGRKYTDSPRAIYEYMLTDPEYSDFRFVWCFRGSVIDEYKPSVENDRTEIVRWGSDEYYKTYATAAYWFANTRLPKAIGKKADQKYIQCWHGTPLKKLGCDITTAATESPEDTKEAVHGDVRRYDYLVSPSRYCSEKLSSAFDLTYLGKEDIILEAGYPRNDSLSTADDEKCVSIRRELGIDPDKKVILYAPTYREDQRAGAGKYEYVEPLDLDRLRKELGGDYHVLFRTHYFIRDGADLSDYSGFITDVSEYPEINDLYIASDMLVTDYSSVFFDFAVLRRPVIFYMYDLEHYRDTLRGLYLGLDDLNGPMAEDQTALTDLILRVDEWFQSAEWQERYDKFCERFTYLDDGHAAERVVKTVIVTN